MKTPTEHLEALRREFPNSEIHHCWHIGMGGDRKDETPKHYSGYPCLTRAEHDRLDNPRTKEDYMLLAKAQLWVIRRLCRDMKRESENYGEVEGWPV